MEKVQGLPYRGKDGPTMQSWPAHQHDFFQAQTCNIVTQNGHLDSGSTFKSVDDTTSSHQLPLPWHLTQVDHQDGNVSGARNWSHNWEWDSLALTAQATVSGTKRGAYSQLGGRDSQFSSPSPPENYEENGIYKEPTLLEFGLNSRIQAVSEDDGLLDLKLGGSGHVPGAGEVSPSSKRSRHSPSENQQTRCQVNNCLEDLQNAKDYHRRHKVCEFHAKAPKALVNTLMQRFCQQCSRFHLLTEFDDDRRSCRKRLAGHNRRRRKTQPDAATALACLLADQSVLSRIIGPSGQQQGKDELEKLLQEQTLLQTLLNARAAVGNAESKRLESAPQNNLLDTISKSQLLSNFLLSNSTIGSNLAVTPAPAEGLISALSTALLSSLPRLQKVNADVGHGGSVPIQQSQEPYTNVVGSHTVSKQNAYSQFSLEEQPGPPAFLNSKERPAVLPTTPPVYGDKTHSSNGDSLDERLHSDAYQRGARESFSEQDRRHWISHSSEAPFVHSTGNLRMAWALQTREKCLPPDTLTSPQGDQFETVGGLSDRSSDTGLDKQEQTGSLWFKMFDKNPADIPLSMRSKILKWLDHRPSEVEGHIKPGCIILTIFVCMPVHAWEQLCQNIEKSLQKLISISDDDFWSKGRVLAYFGESSALILDGEVYPNSSHRPMQVPSLVLVQPFAAEVGERIDLTLRGRHLRAPGTKVVCAFQGKCTIRGIDSPSNVREKKRDREEGTGRSVATFDAIQEQAVTFTVGPFDSIGRGFIEVEGQMWRGTAVPIIIAEKPICQEISSLEKKYIGSIDEHSAEASPSTLEADIIHFLHELGWLLQRIQRKDHYLHLEMPNFSIERYRWLLRFAVEHSCCAVVRWILDLLFKTHDSSEQQGHSRALEVLLEAHLLHVAVRSKSRDMVNFLVAYTPPVQATATESKQELVFRPDSSICDGFTPLHVAASMQSAEDVVDALTDAPAEIWATAWTSAKDAFGQTPLMYALSSGNDGYVKMVQGKLQKLCLKEGNTAKPPHLALNIGDENVKSSFVSSLQKSLPTKQLQLCSCRAREAQLGHSLPLRIRGLNKGFMYRPFVLSMLAVAAVCVCVGVLMRSTPDDNLLGPFVWDSIRFGSI